MAQDWLDPNMGWYENILNARAGNNKGNDTGDARLATTWGTPEQNAAALAGWGHMLAGALGGPAAQLAAKGLTNAMGIKSTSMSPIAQGGKVALGLLGQMFNSPTNSKTFSLEDYTKSLEAEDEALGDAFGGMGGIGAVGGGNVGQLSTGQQVDFGDLFGAHGDTGGGVSGVGEDGNFGSDAALGIYADGGPVQGPGTGTSDSVNARLSNGEYVMPADVVSQLGVEFFDKIKNAYHKPTGRQAPGYADGGLFGGLGSLFGNMGVSDWLGIAGGLSSLYNQGRAADRTQGFVNNNLNQINQLYSPDSPEYKGLWDEMSRKDAAAGRNSQYGPRSADFLSKIATNKADNLTRFATGMAPTVASANNQDAGKAAGLFGALNRAFGAKPKNMSSVLNYTSPGYSTLTGTTGNVADVPGIGTVDFSDLFGTTDVGAGMFDLSDQLFDDSFWEGLM